MSDETNLESVLESAYGDAPEVVAPVQRPPQPDEQEPEASEEQAEQAEPQEEQEEVAEPEPEFEIEVDGQVEKVVGREVIKELLQKGKHFSRGSEENARVRETLLAQQQMHQITQAFHQYVAQDIQDLIGIQAAMRKFQSVNWNELIDRDFVEAQKKQMEYIQLQHQYNNKMAEAKGKEEQFKSAYSQAESQLHASEQAALVAKLPEWRNSEKRAAEERVIGPYLRGVGFHDAEIKSVMDHRYLVVARDAALYRQLQANKAGKIKQLREAPPVSKPGSPSHEANGKADFQKFRKDFRAAGQKRNHKAQEGLLLSRLERTFK